MAKIKKKSVTIVVSSTVYGNERYLDQIFGMLSTYGYHVLMSRQGTIPLNPKLSAFENCLQAVETADIFLGMITPKYGSGIVPGTDKSITHLELLRAIELGKLRYTIAHENVITARRLLIDLGFSDEEKRRELSLRKGAQIISHTGVIDMYEAATLEEVPLANRVGNWVQPYRNQDDVVRYIEEQFANFDRVYDLVIESTKAKGAKK